MTTYLVRIGGCQPGTITTLGTVAATERVDIDHTRVTFKDGSTVTKRYNQTLCVIEAA